jgi:hypothetical protein
MGKGRIPTAKSKQLGKEGGLLKLKVPQMSIGVWRKEGPEEPYGRASTAERLRRRHAIRDKYHWQFLTSSLTSIH